MTGDLHIYTTNVGGYTGNCESAIANASKTANIADFTLSNGCVVTLKFSNACNKANATMNITGTGAKSMYYHGASVPTTLIKKDDYVTFVYDGTNYVIIGINYWFDAWDTWRLNLEDGAVTNLMTPPGLKELVKNSSRLEHGKRYVIPAPNEYASPKFEEQTVDLPIHIITNSSDDYFTRYQSFCDMVLQSGKFALWTKYIPNKIFRLVYNSCSNFNQGWRQIAIFTLRCTQPDPTDVNIGDEGTPKE